MRIWASFSLDGVDDRAYAQDEWNEQVCRQGIRLHRLCHLNEES